MLNFLFNQEIDMRTKFIIAVAFIFAMILAFAMHEFAHGLVAYWNGDNTAKSMGRLTLNPFRHLDLFGTISLVLVGFGWAKPVPVNPNNFTKLKRGIFTVSIAGVTMNLILAIVNFLLLLIVFAISNAVGVTTTIGSIVFQLFYYFFLYGITINLTLMAFNLIPIYPLDGFHIVEAFTKYDNKYCVFMRKYGSMVLFALIIFSSLASRIGGIFYYFDIIGRFVDTIAGGIESLMFLIFNLI